LGPPRSASSANPLSIPPLCREMEASSRRVPALASGLESPYQSLRATLRVRVASTAPRFSHRILSPSPSLPRPFLLPSLLPSSSFHTSSRPVVARHHFTSAINHLRLHLRLPMWPSLHHFTSAPLGVESLHLRIIGGCITSPPHHWRLHHFTSASLEAA